MEFFRAYLRDTKFSPVLYGAKPLLDFAIGPTIPWGAAIGTSCERPVGI